MVRKKIDGSRNNDRFLYNTNHIAVLERGIIVVGIILVNERPAGQTRAHQVAEWIVGHALFQFAHNLRRSGLETEMSVTSP